MLGSRNLLPAERSLASHTVSSSAPSVLSGAFNARRRARRVIVAMAESRPGAPVSVLQDQLLQEIEERRRSQAELLKKLDHLSKKVSEDVTSPPMFGMMSSEDPPYLEPEAPQTEPVSDPASPASPARAAPLAGPNVMNVVLVASECAPWSKTGGLGDVMGALPKALARRGHRVMVVVPRYQEYADVVDTHSRVRFSVLNSSQEVGYYHRYVDGVDFVFVDHQSFRLGKDIYSGDRMSQSFRNALLCKAALEAVWHVPLGGVVYGDQNLVFIANDWHTALLPVYLQAHYRDYGKMHFARSLFVIHNMAYQGRAPFDEIHNFELSEQYKEMFRLYDPMFKCEHMNIMKVGLEMAHRVVAVSGGYAWEVQTPEGGWGLNDIIKGMTWKLKGIINGIDYDEWDPATDPHLMSDGYAHYNVATLVEGKRRCKLALQRELGLPENPDVPLIGFVGRLDYQKGVDLIRDSYEWLMGQGVQLVMLGSGRQDLEEALRYMEDNRRSQCRGWVGFSVATSHRITAAADILLMPSRFEPCGLNQLYAMHYGTVPVVHSVGGLRDTVKAYGGPQDQQCTGFAFDKAEASTMRSALHQAMDMYRNNRPAFLAMARRGMEQDLSWDKSAQQYEDAMVAAKFQW